MSNEIQTINKNNSILNLEDIKKQYSFYHGGLDSVDSYYCNCGQFFTKKQSETDSKSEEKTEFSEETLMDIDPELSDIYKTIKFGLHDSLKCPTCNKNYFLEENKVRLITIGNYFLSGFEFVEDSENLFLYNVKVRPELVELNTSNSAIVTSKDSTRKHYIKLFENYKYIKYNKLNRTIFFKDFDAEEIEIDLDEVIKVVDAFFDFDIKVIINIYKMHLFINMLANHVIDVNNINIVEELLSKIRNRHNEIGIEFIKRIISIFFGIIKYSNLSTIGLTKGSNFLYDLMRECDIPKPNVLRENNVTSPIKIFNFLIKNHINKINKEINEDNKEAHEFIYKSKKVRYENEEDVIGKIGEEGEVKVKIKSNPNEKYKEGQVVKTSDGRFEVIQAVNDGSISKFIYNAISKFSDYKQLVKYLKFVNKNQLIELIQKNDLNLLVAVIDLVYFRSGINMKEINHLLPILESYAKNKTYENSPHLGKQDTNYTYFRGFDFTIYDDSIMMMDVLKFDKNRHFDKIKNFPALQEYHDNLIKYFKVVSDEEKNGAFRSFVMKFKMLEDKVDYNGPIEFKLIATPGALINEGIQMKHSASSYVSRVSNENYLIGQIFDRSTDKKEGEFDRFTIGFTYDKLNGLEFDQVKTFCDQQGSDRFKKLMIDWLTVKDISFRPIKDLTLRGE